MPLYLSVERRKHAARRSSLELVVRTLKERRQALKTVLRTSTDECESARLHEELALVKAKERKGLKALRGLRKA